jgi:hypothetical protein
MEREGCGAEGCAIHPRFSLKMWWVRGVSLVGDVGKLRHDELGPVVPQCDANGLGLLCRLSIF